MVSCALFLAALHRILHNESAQTEGEDDAKTTDMGPFPFFSMHRFARVRSTTQDEDDAIVRTVPFLPGISIGAFTSTCMDLSYRSSQVRRGSSATCMSDRMFSKDIHRGDDS